ncbi:XRE family transcriptional regulator [Paraburkholderia sp.]|uniref:XRE family transcriptional regulator n=1 Tax=Paraburkholderia sp. TaxID=1926495 RepID=UPI0025F8FC02|nr:XRE family transcriptional regulator [Paraburkholderia sp.]
MKQWKEKLGYYGTQMVQILGLKSARRWRDYADENKLQGIPPANLFMASAVVTLPQERIDSVLETMREIGALIDLDTDPEKQELHGEQQP